MNSCKLRRDLERLAYSIRQAEDYQIPRLKDSVRWFSYYEEELRDIGIRVNCRDLLGFDHRLIVGKEEDAVKHFKETHRKLMSGMVNQRQQQLLDSELQRLEYQCNRINSYIYELEHGSHYEIEEQYGDLAVTAREIANYRYYSKKELYGEELKKLRASVRGDLEELFEGMHQHKTGTPA